MDIDTDNKRGAFPSDDQETADTPDDLELSQDATLEQGESARRDEQIIEQFRENLANNLRRLRARENWTQTDLGNKVGLSQSQVGFLERKRQNIGLPMLIQLSLLFNVEPMELLSDSGNTDEDNKIDKILPSLPESAGSGKLPVDPPNIEPPQIAGRVSPEEAFFGPKPASPPSLPKSADSSMPMEAILGSPDDPLDLAVVSRIVGAAHKRIESLRNKYGSVPMTRAMLIGVLAAVLNASHDVDDECGGKEFVQPKVDK